MLEEAQGQIAERQLQVLVVKVWQGEKSLSFHDLSTTAGVEMRRELIPRDVVSDEDKHQEC